VAINLRDLEIFKPYSNEMPEELLLNEGATDAVVDLWLQAQLLRVVKLDEQVLGAYAMQRHDSNTFYLYGVVIAPGQRQQGIGRWLTGHAIGVAESKGGRRILMAPGRQARSTRMFSTMGFIRHRDNPTPVWRFDLIPE